MENCKFLGKFVVICPFRLFLIRFLFEAANTCFVLISVKFTAVFSKTNVFERSKMAAKMADML